VIDDAREAGRQEAERVGPVTDPAVIERVAALLQAACNTSPSASNGASRRGAAAKTDTGDTAPDVCQPR